MQEIETRLAQGVLGGRASGDISTGSAPLSEQRPGYRSGAAAGDPPASATGEERMLRKAGGEGAGAGAGVEGGPGAGARRLQSSTYSRSYSGSSYSHSYSTRQTTRHRSRAPSYKCARRIYISSPVPAPSPPPPSWAEPLSRHCGVSVRRKRPRLFSVWQVQLSGLEAGGAVQLGHLATAAHRRVGALLLPDRPSVPDGNACGHVPGSIADGLHLRSRCG